MKNYAKLFFDELKDRFEKYLLTLTDDKVAIQKAINSFKFPDDPKAEDVDRVCDEFVHHMQRELPFILGILTDYRSDTVIKSLERDATSSVKSTDSTDISKQNSTNDEIGVSNVKIVVKNTRH